GGVAAIRRSRHAAGCASGRAAARLLRADAQIVLHVLHAGDAFREVFGMALGEALVHRSRQGDLAIVDRSLDFGSIDVRVVGEAVADILADAIVRARVVLRTASAVAGV